MQRRGAAVWTVSLQLCLNESEMMREADGLIALPGNFPRACRSQSTWKTQTATKNATERCIIKALNTEICRYTCQKIEEAGFYPMVYANLDWFRNKLILSELDRYDLWLAQWNVNGRRCPAGCGNIRAADLCRAYRDAVI